MNLLEAQPWMLHAECRGVDADLFFPRRGDVETVKAAKAVCAVCPVRAQCLAFAMAPPSERHGIWGGLSERERRRIRRQQRKAAV